MKKTILLVGLLAATAVQAQNAECALKSCLANGKYQIKAGFESEYVVRGIQQADAVGILGAEANFDGLYVGAQTVQPEETRNNEANESKLYIGHLTTIDDTSWVIDMGYAYTFNPENGVGDNVNRGNEVKLGVRSTTCPLTGLPVNPSLTGYYNFDAHALTVEAGIGHKWCLGCLLGVDELKGKLGLDVGAKIGVVTASDIGSGQVAALNNQDNGYTYYTLNADVVWKINETYSARVGARATGNNDGRSVLPQSNYAGVGSRESNLFWGASVSAGF